MPLCAQLEKSKVFFSRSAGDIIIFKAAVLAISSKTKSRLAERFTSFKTYFAAASNAIG